MKDILEKRIQDLDNRKNLLRIDRKIEFLLDVRGYFVVNKIKGCYVEFGCFNGEMLFSANKILGDTGICSNFLGLDTFEGEPLFQGDDAGHNKYNTKGDYSATYYEAKSLLKECKNKNQLIVGDFREDKVKKKVISAIKKNPINVSVIDCNLLSSIKESADITFQNIKNGGFLFVDDYYTNMSKGKMPVKDILEESANAHGKRLHRYKVYSPFGEAFIVLRKSK